MLSTTDQVSYLRAQLAQWDAQLEQVRAERDNHLTQEEEVLAHTRLLSSEAKDWKSSVVTEAEEVLCRESAQAAHQATEAQEAMDQHHKAKWRQAEATSKLYVNPTAPKRSPSQPNCRRQIWNTMSSILHKRDSYDSRHKPYDKLKSRNNKQRKWLKNVKLAIQELRRQAEEQPAIQKTLWRRQLSQRSTYKAEIHELYTEMLNMREESYFQSHSAANMCKLEHSIPSRSVESEPENELNTRSPGRCSSWILPSEMETSRQANVFRSAITNRCTSPAWSKPTGPRIQSPQSMLYTSSSMGRHTC